MTLWIILAAMALAAIFGLVDPLLRRPGAGRHGSTLAVLKSQLADLDAQVAAGTLAADEADGLRIEIKRRLLAEGRESIQPDHPFSRRAQTVLAGGLAALVAVGALVLYVRVGHPGLPMLPHSSAASADADAPANAQVTGIIAKLQSHLAQVPADTEGWRVLGWAYLRSRRPSDAANAYGRAIALSPMTAEDRSAQGDALAQAAGGQVTPAATAQFRAALLIDKADPRARYFLALAREQQGDHAGAMADWIALLKSAPPGAVWVGDVRDFVERVARAHGEDISAQLGTVAGSSMQEFPPAVVQMVEALASALKQNPRNEDGWMRLMRSWMVMGQTKKASDAYHDALAAFSDSPSAQTRLRAGAHAFGVPGA